MVLFLGFIASSSQYLKHTNIKGLCMLVELKLDDNQCETFKQLKQISIGIRLFRPLKTFQYKYSISGENNILISWG